MLDQAVLLAPLRSVQIRSVQRSRSFSSVQFSSQFILRSLRSTFTVQLCMMPASIWFGRYWALSSCFDQYIPRSRSVRGRFCYVLFWRVFLRTFSRKGAMEIIIKSWPLGSLNSVSCAFRPTSFSSVQFSQHKLCMIDCFLPLSFSYCGLESLQLCIMFIHSCVVLLRYLAKLGECSDSILLFFSSILLLQISHPSWSSSKLSRLRVRSSLSRVLNHTSAHSQDASKTRCVLPPTQRCAVTYS